MYQGILKATVSGVFEDLKFKISAFWNFKLKVLKYPTNCRLHATLIQKVLKNPESAKIHTYFQIRSTIFGFWQQFLWPSVVGTECTEDALGLSKIAFGMQKLARIFNFDKQDIIDFTKLSKPAMCRAGPLICLLEYSSLPPLALECQR